MGDRIKKFKQLFDRVTSQNSTNWQLVIFWLIIIEIIASIIEFMYVDDSIDYAKTISHTLYTEVVVAGFVTIFVWYCIYNIIYGSRNTVLKLMVFSTIGVYFIVTSDFTLEFLMQNLNPFHFFDLKFSLVFFVELFIKLLMTYLVYQLIVTIKNRSQKDSED